MTNRKLGLAALVVPVIAIVTILVVVRLRDNDAASVKPPVGAGNGQVVGVVKLESSAPAPRVVAEGQCHPGAKPVYDDSLVVDADGGMQNVLVYILDGPNVPLPPAPATLDQVNCQFTPHVLAIRAGQPLSVRSSDPVLHNVHAAKPANNKPFNLAFPIKGQEQTLTLTKAEAAPIEVRCDVHQWMRAYVAVFDHPFFAVTGNGGRFAISSLPAGQYTLVAWHEKYGEKRQKVTIGPASPSMTPVEFRFGL